MIANIIGTLFILSIAIALGFVLLGAIAQGMAKHRQREQVKAPVVQRMREREKMEKRDRVVHVDSYSIRKLRKEVRP